MAQRLGIIVCALLCTAPQRSAAEAPQATPQEGKSGDEIATAPTTRKRALAVGTAAVPGLLWHGAGLQILGEHEAAKDVLIAQWTGVALGLAGGLPILLTGASSRISYPSTPLLLSGLGVFSLSWLSGVYGASGGHRISASPPPNFRLRTQMGVAYVRDPQFAYSTFLSTRFDYRVGALRISPSSLVATSAGNQRFRGEVAYRLRGETRPGIAAGSYVDVGTALTWHRFADDEFSRYLGEVSVKGRLHLGDLSPVLRGAFAELSTGLGLEFLDYWQAGFDENSLLLGDFAFGMWFGETGSTQGEIALGYDHRRDEFAGGAAHDTHASGIAGHFGGRARLLLRSGLLFSVESWRGSAQTYHLSLGWQQ